MIKKQAKLLVLGWEDLNLKTRKEFEEEKVDETVYCDVSISNFSRSAKENMIKAEVVIYIYGVNRILLKYRE